MKMQLVTLLFFHFLFVFLASGNYIHSTVYEENSCQGRVVYETYQFINSTCMFYANGTYLSETCDVQQQTKIYSVCKDPSCAPSSCVTNKQQLGICGTTNFVAVCEPTVGDVHPPGTYSQVEYTASCGENLDNATVEQAIIHYTNVCVTTKNHGTSSFQSCDEENAYETVCDDANCSTNCKKIPVLTLGCVDVTNFVSNNVTCNS
jgi:hypothetical protein